MRWFKHMSNSSQDERLACFMDKYGLEAYGFFWLVLEAIAANVDETGRRHVEYPLKKWCKLLGIRPQTFRKLIYESEFLGLFRVCFNSDLVSIESPNILKYRDEWTRKKGINSGATPDKLPPKQKQSNNTPPLPPPAGGESVSLFGLGTIMDDTEGKLSTGLGEPAFGTLNDTGDGKQSSGTNSHAQKHELQEKTARTPKRNRKPKGADLPPYTAWFEECWTQYPNKNGKGEAWRAFYELDLEGQIPADMARRIENRALDDDWLENVRNRTLKYIPRMTTWLHQRGWEDAGCFDEEENRNTEEDEQRNEIMGKYNFGMPLPGESREEAVARNGRMNAELEAAGL